MQVTYYLGLCNSHGWDHNLINHIRAFSDDLFDVQRRLVIYTTLIYLHPNIYVFSNDIQYFVMFMILSFVSRFPLVK